jgi:protein TonB
MKQLADAARQIDEHLVISSTAISPSGVAVRLTASSSKPPLAPGTVTVGGRVQSAKLISKVDPVYPNIARQARISGTVELAVIIGPDGHVQDAHVISGHPLLRAAAMDVVPQWVYQPTLLKGQPVAVSTTVDVIFSLEQ